VTPLLSKGRRARTLTLVPLALVLVAMAAVYAVASTAGHARNESSRRTGNFGTSNPAYATQSGTLEATRKANITFQNNENYDQSYEACHELGLQVLARQFHTAATPTAVARRWAATELPAFYRGTFTGCRDALEVDAPPPFRKPDAVGRASGP
jgi:hypothetical protein